MPISCLMPTVLAAALTGDLDAGSRPALVSLSPQLGLSRGISSLVTAWHPGPPPEFIPGLKTINRGYSVEVLEPKSGLALRAGNISLPTNPDGGRPYYLIFDERPGSFLTVATDNEMGVQADYRVAKAVGFTIGAYNNKASYKVGTLPVKNTLGRFDVDFGFAKGGGFFYYGTGRWLGDRTKAGFDLRTRLGPFELTGQVLYGMSYGIEQFGWYTALSHNLSPATTVVARLDQHNPNVHAEYQPDSHVVLAVVHRLSPTRMLKFNVQAGLADPNRAPIVFGPNNWAVLGQLAQRF